MGILDKFQNPESAKAITDELKSKVGITSDKLTDDKQNKNTAEQSQPIEQSTVGQLTTGADSVEPKGKKAATKVKEPTKEINDKPLKRKELKEEQKALPQNEMLVHGEISQAEFEAIISTFKETYKKSDKENRMIRLQKKNYKNLIKLKLDRVSISEFINFAIIYALKSNRYDNIVKLLKPPK